MIRANDCVVDESKLRSAPPMGSTEPSVAVDSDEVGSVDGGVNEDRRVSSAWVDVR